jgi:hypothetical protein
MVAVPLDHRVCDREKPLGLRRSGLIPLLNPIRGAVRIMTRVHFDILLLVDS